MIPKPPHGLVVEEIGVVLKSPGQTIFGIDQVERQVELRRPALEDDPGTAHPRNGPGLEDLDGRGRPIHPQLVRNLPGLDGATHGLQRRVLQDEHHLEQRRPAQVTLRLQLFDELFEGQVLVSQCIHAHLIHAANHFPKRGITG